MAKYPIYLQRIDTIRQTLSSTEFIAASEELRIFMNEKRGLNEGIYTLTDPHVVGFKVFFDFNEEHGLLASPEYFDSAEAYLNRIGETNRAEILARFKKLLSLISSQYSHQMTNIEGVAESYGEGFGVMSREEKPQLTINFFETLDQKIVALNQMYRMVAYDKTRHVWVLPSNLREFKIRIYLFDASFYVSDLNFLPSFENQDLAKINHTMFEYSHCTIAENSGSVYYDTIQRGNTEWVGNNLVIDYGNVDESALFRNITGDTPINHINASIFLTALADTLQLNNINVQGEALPDPNRQRPTN